MLGLGLSVGGLAVTGRKGPPLPPNLVTNGDFSNGLTGWTNGGGHWTAVGGRAYHASSNIYRELSQPVAGTGSLRIEFDAEVLSGAGTALVYWINAAGVEQAAVQIPAGTSRVSLTATTGMQTLAFCRNPGTTGEFYIDNVSVRQVP